MNSFVVFLLLVGLLSLSIAHEERKRRQDDDVYERNYKCLDKQLCNCGSDGYERFQQCYDKLPEIKEIKTAGIKTTFMKPGTYSNNISMAKTAAERQKKRRKRLKIFGIYVQYYQKVTAQKQSITQEEAENGDKRFARKDYPARKG
ncbi:hypothetical protein JTE90_027800 [Oedothorax gibbosus]|uniref:Uncharacterized protein n=1 Tax=Oedothorax gibbosus TaxID=931172 RepID=A0AAV6V7V9_9ARAC|nr:hypothetical protein JTE90_027800 [Oedothorax gibbosus]